ncbi:MAG: ParB partition protein [Parcubacteria group bacterium GW2011_GWC1_39_29]|uniref:ParB-like protein partition protein n=1 Tax=Candidatus Yanofskybacteria bacterium GW2011_GWD1_39_16 TaxID=1619030 RepID=A0A837HS89_9BACT|nr:MAG: ParB-like protein partition protein [Candidatus Yanofskybacteria bacterium GW2011_GWD1_39_16]KKR14001.1 MAG: ParB partition protein [Parcubacteria group bacterium GW2011_GWC1_39_29]
MKKLFGLGKGLGSLIPPTTNIKPQLQKENVFYVEINKVRPNPNQPRRDFDGEGIKELAKSIRKYGVLQPLLVTKIEEQSNRGLDVSYSLIAGERRLRAAREAGLPHVPVIIRDDFDEDRTKLEVALIENVQRKDLNPIEEAEAYNRFSKEFGLTQKEIAEKVSKSREVVANAVRLLSLPEDIKESVRTEKISRAHARALLAFSDEAKQRSIYGQIINAGLSSKEVEEIASIVKGASAKVIKEPAKFFQLEKNLGDMLAVPVSIHSGGKGGRIIIRFASLEELNKIAKTIID